MKVWYFASLRLALEFFSREISEVLLFSFLTALCRSAVFEFCCICVGHKAAEESREEKVPCKYSPHLLPEYVLVSC